MRIYYYIIICIYFIVTSCNKTDEIVQEKKIETIERKSSDTNIQSTIEHFKPVSKSELLDSKILEKYLPVEILGFKKYPGSSGNFYGNGYSWTTASSDYKHYKKGYFTIGIFNYGKNGFIPEMNSFFKLPLETGMKSKQIKIKNGNGYILLDEITNSGRLNVLFYNRFVIKIETYSLSKDSPDLEKILNYIKIDELIKN